MLNFTREQKGKAFDKLPKEIKQGITSDAFTSAFQKIGNDFKLPIDKIGQLGDLVILTMLNLVKTTDFTDNLKKEIGIDEYTAVEITKKVNEDIFLKARQLLKESVTDIQEEDSSDSFPQKTENTIRPPEEHPSKEEILHEIENPTQNEAPKKPSTELMVGRLTGIVQIPGGKSQIPVKKPVPPTPPSQPLQKTVSQNPNDQRPRSSDPYREPIN